MLNDSDLRTINALQEVIKRTLTDYSVKYSVSVDNESGFNELDLQLVFIGDVEVWVTFNIETGKLIVGEDSEDEPTPEAIWRLVAFKLAWEAAVI